MFNDSETKLRRVLTVANIQAQKIEKVAFTNEWFQAFGKPQNRGVWFIWGASSSGKSTFIMMLAKEFAKTTKVLYNLLEEESDDSDYIERMNLCDINEVSNNFLTASYTYEELDYYLSKKNSPKVVVIDSLPYFTKDWDAYLRMKRKFKNKIFLIVGHAEGKHPSTDFQKRVMYDAKMKIFISGFLAVCNGRTVGPNGGEFVIWQDGYEKLRGISEN